MDAVQALGNDGVSAIARDLGIDPQTAAAGAAALLPALLGGFQKQAAGGGGLAGLLGGLGGAGGAGGLLEAVLGQQQTPVAQGNDVLGQIFGSKDVSRTVAADAAGKSGLSPDLLRKMLPIVAMLAAGYLSKGGAAQAGTGGGLGGLLGGLLGGQQAAPAGQAGGLGGLISMLDANGNGNPLDDILGMAAKLGR